MKTYSRCSFTFQTKCGNNNVILSILVLLFFFLANVCELSAHNSYACAHSTTDETEKLRSATNKNWMKTEAEGIFSSSKWIKIDCYGKWDCIRASFDEIVVSIILRCPEMKRQKPIFVHHFQSDDNWRRWQCLTLLFRLSRRNNSFGIN